MGLFTRAVTTSDERGDKRPTRIAETRINEMAAQGGQSP
jgi:hypothetical protein